jgi:hypothetical protein
MYCFVGSWSMLSLVVIVILKVQLVCVELGPTLEYYIIIL